MFTVKNVAFSLGVVVLIGMIECRPEAPPPKPKVRLNLICHNNKTNGNTI